MKITTCFCLQINTVYIFIFDDTVNAFLRRSSCCNAHDGSYMVLLLTWWWWAWPLRWTGCRATPWPERRRARARRRRWWPPRSDLTGRRRSKHQDRWFDSSWVSCCWSATRGRQRPGNQLRWDFSTTELEFLFFFLICFIMFSFIPTWIWGFNPNKTLLSDGSPAHNPPTYTPWGPGGSTTPGPSSSWTAAGCRGGRTCSQWPRAAARLRPPRTQTAGTSNRSWGRSLGRRPGRSCNSGWCRERWTCGESGGGRSE